MSATTFDGAWDLSPADRLLVEAKRWGSRLGFAVMLLFYRAQGRFPRGAAEVDREAVADLAHRLGVPAPGSRAALLPASDDRTLKRQRAEIRALLGFREATVADAEDLGAWLRDTVVPRTRDVAELTAEAEGHRQLGEWLVGAALARVAGRDDDTCIAQLCRPPVPG